MSPEAQRIAIAKACGKDLTAFRFQFQPRVRDTPQWSPAYGTREEAQNASDEEVRRWQTPVWPVEQFTNPGDAPDYLSDLNAIHEAEKVLRGADVGRYLHFVGEVSKGKAICATAAQRAEAFLRTIGKWTHY